MQATKGKKIAKSFAHLLIFGVVSTFASALYKSEFNFPPRIEPCIMIIFRIPLKQISYGLPISWLVTVEGVYKYGCGPVVSHFLTYSLQWQGFLGDVLFYAFCCSLILYCKSKFKRTETSSIADLSQASPFFWFKSKRTSRILRSCSS